VASGCGLGAAGSLGEPWGAPGSGQGAILEALKGPNDEACPGAASSPGAAPTQVAGDFIVYACGLRSMLRVRSERLRASRAVRGLFFLEVSSRNTAQRSSNRVVRPL
jgi:hypothetical protein